MAPLLRALHSARLPVASGRGDQERSTRFARPEILLLGEMGHDAGCGATRWEAEPGSPLQYGNVFSYPMLGRNITCCLGPEGSNMVFNGKLAYVNAEQAYTHLTTP